MSPFLAVELIVLKNGGQTDGRVAWRQLASATIKNYHIIYNLNPIAIKHKNKVAKQ